MISASYDPDLGERNGSSVAARWISGLGAFLLVAAATTFVAVRWDDIPDEAKLGALVALTVTCLASEIWLRGRFPITAGAVFHLGVLLVPIDVATVGVWFEWGWPAMLLSQGLVITAACGIAGHERRSVVLVTVAALGVVPLAAGTGAVLEMPAGLLLAFVALGATVTSLRSDSSSRDATERASAFWAALAGLATPLAAAENLGLAAAGVLSDIGIAGDAPHPLAAATGAVSCAALAVVGARRQSLPVALLGVASLLAGTVTTWVGTSPSAAASLVALATVLLLTEAAAWLLGRDGFWARPTAVVAGVGEVIGGLMTAGFATVLLSAPFQASAYPAEGLAAAIVALAWIASTSRVAGRLDPRHLWPWTITSARWRGIGPSAATLAAAAAATLATDSRPARALTIFLVGLAATAVPAAALPGAASARIVAAGLLAGAPVVVSTQPELAGPLALASALVVAAATVDAARFSGTPGFNRLVYALTYLSLAPLATGGIILAADGQPAVAAAGIIGAFWLLAALLDRITLRPALLPHASPFGVTYRLPLSRPLPVGMVPRLAAVGALAIVPLAGDAVTAGEATAIAAFFAVLSLVDAVRLDEPYLVVGAGCAVPIALTSVALMTDATLAQASVAVTASALVWLGVGGRLPGGWAPAAVLSGGVAAASGLVMSADESWGFSTNLVVVGLAVVAMGLVIDHLGLVAAGGCAATFGTWDQLGHHDVTASEAYMAPAAVMLLLGGLYARASTRPVSSWLAYAPAVALLGGTGLVERLNEGSTGWHAVVAGAVGVVAVVAGGMRRLAGPLVTGTVIVVAVTVHETLGATARIPTWTWLAAGGATLLAIGLWLERQGTGPLETGRRLVDLIGERFS